MKYVDVSYLQTELGYHANISTGNKGVCFFVMEKTIFITNKNGKNYNGFHDIPKRINCYWFIKQHKIFYGYVCNSNKRNNHWIWIDMITKITAYV